MVANHSLLVLVLITSVLVVDATVTLAASVVRDTVGVVASE